MTLDLYVESGESDDDLCVTSAHHNPHQPVFLSRKEKESLCELLDIPLCEETDFDQIHSTLEDGNCLFRAISHAISDSEENHQILRMKTIKHAQKNSEKFRVILREGYSSVNEYIKNTEIDKLVHGQQNLKFLHCPISCLAISTLALTRILNGLNFPVTLSDKTSHLLQGIFCYSTNTKDIIMITKNSKYYFQN